MAGAGSPLPTPSAASWRADVDWLRVVGMAAVFVVHVALVFVPWAPWHIQSRERSDALGQLVLAVAPWVMPLFMMLAGESAYFSLRRRTGRIFVAERVRHLLVPLLVGILVLVPPQVYLERRLAGAFDGSLLAFYPRFFDGVYPSGNFAWHHLWFLGYLFALSLAGLPLFRLLERGGGRRVVSTLAGWAGRPGGLLLLALPLVLLRVALSEPLALLGGTAADWHNRTLLPAAFVAGYVFAADARFARAAVEQWRRHLVVALAVTAAFFAYAATGDPVARVPAAGSVASLLFWGAYALGACSAVLALVGAARAHASGGRRLRQTSEAVLPFYLLHQPFIVLVAFLIVQRSWAVLPSAVVIGVVALALSLAGTLLLQLATGRWSGSDVLGDRAHAAHAGAHGDTMDEAAARASPDRGLPHTDARKPDRPSPDGAASLSGPPRVGGAGWRRR